MTKKTQNIKFVIARVPESVWEYTKKAAFEEGKSINLLVKEILISFKNKREKRLTNSDNMIT